MTTLTYKEGIEINEVSRQQIYPLAMPTGEQSSHNNESSKKMVYQID